MAEDFGDYSGEKLFDWMMRLGQEAGGSAAMAAADKLKAALDNARGAAGPGDGAGEEARWAKLDMHEFTGIEDWPTLKDLIDGKLDGCGIAHEWYREGRGATYLLFRADDAPSLVRAFDEMSKDVDAAKSRAESELARQLANAREKAREIGRDGGVPRARTGATERLADKVEMAKAAADEINRGSARFPERDRRIDRERTQGR